MKYSYSALVGDFRVGLRVLRKSPVFSLTAIVTIALGIAAVTSIFSVADAVLIRPLDYKEPQSLVIARSDMLKRNVRDFPFSDADFLDLKNGSKEVFEEIAAVRTTRTPYPLPDGSSEQLREATVTANFFTMLGGRIVAGRTFENADGQAPPAPAVAQVGPPVAQAPAAADAAAAPPPGPPPVAILSHEYWQRRFGGDRSILGKPLHVQGPVVVGVVRPGFELSFPPSADMDRKPDIWLAARIAYDNVNRNQVSWRVIGRLRPGVTIDRAQTAADRVAAELRRNFTIRETAGFAIFLQSMYRNLVETARPAILALMGAVVFLLLIACANVANLLLVRASLREREYAVRAALGGGWWRLMRQTMAEVLLLALAGTALGIGIARVLLGRLLQLAPANLPRLDTVRIDAGVVLLASLAGLAAAAVFGIAPVFRLARPNMMQVLRTDGRSPSLGGGGLLRGALVVAEIALCFVLLFGSGLMVRSFIALQRTDPGFDARNMITLELAGVRGNTPQERAAIARQLQQAFGSLSGVNAVTAMFPVPLGGRYGPIRWGTEQALADASRFQAADPQVVLPGYFETMRSRVLAGRTFSDADNVTDRKFVIVDETLARKAFGGAAAAVGKRILVRVRTPEPEWVEIIGVVGHEAFTSLAEPGHEQVYFADAFFGFGNTAVWGLRSSATADPASLYSQARAAVAKIDSRAVVVNTTPMSEFVGQALAATRFQLLLISVFAVVAALLAAVGIYGVLSTVVRQRTAEIGVRMALGASSSNVFLLIVGQGLRWSAIGIAIGAAVSFGAARGLSAMLVGVQPADPATFAAVSLGFLCVGALAAWIPARRAAGLDPNGAMRNS